MPLYGQLNCRDRTPEFTAFVERLQQEQGGTSESGSKGNTPGARTNGHAGQSQQSEFARRAGRIGLCIHGTSQKLSKLALLAKRTSMFDDPAAEIQDLTGVIKQDIEGMNAAIADLQQLSATDEERNKQNKDHSVVVVDSLRTKLKNATKSFSDVLTIRTEGLRGNEDRRRMFSAPSPQPKHQQQLQHQHKQPQQLPGASLQHRALPPPSFPGSGSSAMLPRSSSAARSAQDLFGGNRSSKSQPGSDPNSSSGEKMSLLQQQQQQQVVLQDTYHESRSEALQNVESTIVELGGIFQQLAHMVHEQGEMAVRIDENLDDAVTNVDSAQAQLLKYLNTVSSNRWLIMKILAVLLFFSMIFLAIT